LHAIRVAIGLNRVGRELRDVRLDGMPRDELVAAYWRYSEACDASGGGPEVDDLRWAWDYVFWAMVDGYQGAMQLLVDLAHGAPAGDDPLCELGAGPLEDLLRLHPNSFVDQVEEAARIDPAVRRALRCVWFGPDMTPVQIERLQRIAGAS
jgi:hypothetical protein